MGKLWHSQSGNRVQEKEVFLFYAQYLGDG